MMDLATFGRRLFAVPGRPDPAAVRRFRKVLEGAAPASSLRPRRKLLRGMESRKLFECCNSPNVGVDGDEGYTLRGVRVLGENSLNRRRYTREAMSVALPMYEGAKVFLDHPDNPHGNRSVKDLVGILSGPAMDGSGVLADLTLNPSHPFVPAVAWLAKNAPSAIGLSHNAVGEGKTEDGVFIVNRIVSVRSVDLVIDPATVKGLFS